MPEYSSIEELWNKYVCDNRLAKNFLERHRCLSVASLREFAEKYEKNKRGSEGGAKFSERVFSYWIAKELFEYDASSRVRIHDNREIRLHDKTTVDKRIDFSFQRGSGPRVYIEFKCNIDMVEKDLFKFYLMKRNKCEIVTSIFIWERCDKWEYAKGGPSQYARLLEDTQAHGFLDEYFYFPIYDRNEEHIVDGRIKDEITKFCKFLHDPLPRRQRRP